MLQVIKKLKVILYSHCIKLVICLDLVLEKNFLDTQICCLHGLDKVLRSFRQPTISFSSDNIETKYFLTIFHVKKK